MNKKTTDRIKMRKASKTIPRGRAPDPKRIAKGKMLPRVTKKAVKK